MRFWAQKWCFWTQKWFFEFKNGVFESKNDFCIKKLTILNQNFIFVIKTNEFLILFWKNTVFYRWFGSNFSEKYFFSIFFPDLGDEFGYNRLSFWAGRRPLFFFFLFFFVFFFMFLAVVLVFFFFVFFRWNIFPKYFFGAYPFISRPQKWSKNTFKNCRKNRQKSLIFHYLFAEIK